MENYVQGFKWDDAKFPRNVHMTDIVKTLSQVEKFIKMILFVISNRKCMFVIIVLGIKPQLIKKQRIFLRKSPKKSRNIIK